MCSIALKSEGYIVYEAASGREGYESALRNLPDVILCDVNMADGDGKEFLRRIRSDTDLSDRQFVFMTGNPMDVTPRRGMELGADDYLAKPFSMDDLFNCIRARIGRAQVNRRVEDDVLRRLQGTLHQTLPHEFFTPLNGILGLTQLLKGDVSQLNEPESAEVLDHIERAGWMLHRTLRNYLTVVDAESLGQGSSRDTDVVSAISVGEVITTAIANVERRLNRPRVIRQQIVPVALQVSTSCLAHIVEELVDNACKFSRQETEVVISLGAEGELQVEDKGRGMHAAEIGQIMAFQQHDRKRYEQQGLGLGLRIAQSFAQKHGASFRILSAPGEGTTVRVLFQRVGP